MAYQTHHGGHQNFQARHSSTRHQFLHQRYLATPPTDRRIFYSMSRKSVTLTISENIRKPQNKFWMLCSDVWENLHKTHVFRPRIRSICAIEKVQQGSPTVHPKSKNLPPVFVYNWFISVSTHSSHISHQYHQLPANTLPRTERSSISQVHNPTQTDRSPTLSQVNHPPPVLVNNWFSSVSTHSSPFIPRIPANNTTSFPPTHFNALILQHPASHDPPAVYLSSSIFQSPAFSWGRSERTDRNVEL